MYFAAPLRADAPQCRRLAGHECDLTDHPHSRHTYNPHNFSPAFSSILPSSHSPCLPKRTTPARLLPCLMTVRLHPVAVQMQPNDLVELG